MLPILDNSPVYDVLGKTEKSREEAENAIRKAQYCPNERWCPLNSKHRAGENRTEEGSIKELREARHGDDGKPNAMYLAFMVRVRMKWIYTLRLEEQGIERKLLNMLKLFMEI